MKIIRGNNLVYTPASHEDKNHPGVWKKVLYQKGDLLEGKIQMINWAKLRVGKTFQAHYHEDMDEIFIILNGKTKIYLDKEKAELEKGDAVLIPMKAIHKMSNIGSEDVEYLAIGISLGKDGKTIVIEEKNDIR